jgi:hypothetical protein
VKGRARYWPAAVLALAGVVLTTRATAQSVRESEPNNTLLTANYVSLGDTIRGEIAVDADIDYFVVDIPAGTTVQIIQTGGEVIFPICLYDVDGLTRLDCLSDVVASRLAYPLTVSGRYLMKIRSSHASAGYVGIGSYRVVFGGEPFALGPGDPFTVVASPLGEISWARYHIAAGWRGEVYAVDLYKSNVLRIDGYASTFVSDLKLSGGIAVDAFGNLLVSGPDPFENTIWSIAPNGKKVRFATHLGRAYTNDGFRIAVGPDGDVWAGEVNWIWRFDPTGLVKDVIPVPGCAFYALAVSPGGDLHFASETSGCRGIYLVSRNGRQLVVPDSAGELAFDRAGNLYVGAWDRWPDDPFVSPPGEWGRVFVFDPGYRKVEAIARAPRLDGGLIFVRDEQGNMTSRLMTVQHDLNRLVELNGAATREPGSGPSQRFSVAILAPRPSTLASQYEDTLRLPNTAGALQWSVGNGLLPPGLNLSATGVLYGIPVDTGKFNLTVRATNGSQVWFGSAAIYVAPATLSVNQIVDALLGVQPLNPALAEFLDRHGNRNARLDGGDLRAYLRSQDQLVASSTAALRSTQ